MQAFHWFHKTHILKCSFRPDQLFGAVAEDGNGFDFTFLLTISSLFWCAGQFLQILCIAEGYSCLPLPALESRNLASYALPRKSKTSRANAAILWHLYFVFCRDLARCIYCYILLLIICFDCLHTIIIKKLKYDN